MTMADETTREDVQRYAREQAALLLDTDLTHAEVTEAAMNLASAFRDIDTGTVSEEPAVHEIGFTLNALPLGDRIAIVVALAWRKNDLKRMARSRKYAGPAQAAKASRASLRSQAADYDRIGSLLAAAWGLGWKEGS